MNDWVSLADASIEAPTVTKTSTVTSHLCVSQASSPVDSNDAMSACDALSTVPTSGVFLQNANPTTPGNDEAPSTPKSQSASMLSKLGQNQPKTKPPPHPGMLKRRAPVGGGSGGIAAVARQGKVHALRGLYTQALSHSRGPRGVDLASFCTRITDCPPSAAAHQAPGPSTRTECCLKHFLLLCLFVFF